MFPRVGSQIIIEPGSPEDFHVMEVKNVSRDGLNMTGSRAMASGKYECKYECYSGFGGPIGLDLGGVRDRTVADGAAVDCAAESWT